MALRSKQPASEPRPSVPCAHDLCPQPALVRVKLEQGWANLCRKHYEYHAQRQANEFCIANGLETLEQKRAYCMEKSKMFGQAGKALLEKAA